MSQAQQTAVLPAPRPRGRRWRRRLLWTLAVLALLVLLAPLALALGPVRDRVAGEIGKALGRRVEIESAFAFWGRGVDLEGITVHSPEGFDGPLATIQRVHADLDVLALLAGRVSAAVRVIEPHVTYRRNARDEGNAEGVLEKLQPKEEEHEEEAGEGPDLGLVVLGGRVESLGSATQRTAVVDGIQFTLDLRRDGALALSLLATARGAGRGGEDARIAADLDIGPDGAGPFKIEAPALELDRLAGILRDATGIRDLAGTLELGGDGQLLADGRLRGRLRVRAENLRGVRRGVEVALQRAEARADLESTAQDTGARLHVRLDRLSVRRGPVGQREHFDEPLVTLTTSLRYAPQAGTVQVESARLDAGSTATLATTAPLKLETEPALRFEGQAYARADLGRLGRLRGLVPQLDALEAGTLEAQVSGAAREGLAISGVLTIGGLRIARTSWAPEGYAESRVALHLAVSHDAREVTTLRLERLESALARATFPPGQDAFEVKVDGEGRVGVDGSFDLLLNLPALSRLVGTELGLERGEQLEGSLRLVGSSRGDAARSHLDVTLTGRALRVPQSWVAIGRPTSLRSVLAVATTPADVNVQVKELEVLDVGIVGRGRLRIDRAGHEAVLADGEGSLRADLLRARPWIGPALGLARDEHLAGDLTAQVRLADAGGRQRLVSRTEVRSLDWRRRPASRPVRQQRVLLETDVQLADGSARHRADVLKLTADGLDLDLSGATGATSPATDLDATLRLGGDAARLAPLLGALLGEGYEDLRGSGKLAGSLRLRGSPEDDARTLRVDGGLDLGAWSTSGVSTTAVRLESSRAGPAQPLMLALSTNLNGGPTQVGMHLQLGSPSIPWNATVKIDGADTSGLLVSKGPGRFLAYVLPALVPAEVPQPVLSGRLLADLSGASSSLSSPGLQDALRGRGSVSMRQGEIRQSTLFGRGGSGLAKVVTALSVAVPEAGAVLSEASKALTFTSLDSQFRVANRVVEVQQVNLRGQRLHVDMNGRVDFEHRVALRAMATVQGGAGRALAKYVPGAAIPLAITGSFEQPRAVPDVDLKTLVGGVAGRLPDVIDDIKKKLPKLPGIK